MKVLKFKKSKKKLNNSYVLIIQSKHKSVYSDFSEKLGNYFISPDSYNNKYFYVNLDRLFFWVNKGLIINPKIYKMIHSFTYFYER